MSLDNPLKGSVATKPRRWKRRLRWMALALAIAFIAAAYGTKDYARTLNSLRRIPGTNAFVMDYYANYHLDEIRTRGMDVDHVDDSLIETLFPDLIVPIVRWIKSAYLPQSVRTIDPTGHHCSTVALRSEGGGVFFGRNFDWHHDACLIVRTHDGQGTASISVLDLAYLNLNRADLDQSSLITRLPLLFAPYYLMDGMNRHGVAVADLSAKAVPPREKGKPDIILATLMRFILDEAKDVDDAVSLVQQFNVYFVDTQEHLMVADSSGRSRVIEFIDGEVRVTSTSNPWQVCTNHILWNLSEDQNDEVCSRYRTGSDLAEGLGHAVDHGDAVRIARNMSVPGFTMWTSVYSLSSLQAHIMYRTDESHAYRDTLDKFAGKALPNP
jgi:hypothetical protein